MKTFLLRIHLLHLYKQQHQMASDFRITALPSRPRAEPRPGSRLKAWKARPGCDIQKMAWKLGPGRSRVTLL